MKMLTNRRAIYYCTRCGQHKGNDAGYSASLCLRCRLELKNLRDPTYQGGALANQKK